MQYRASGAQGQVAVRFPSAPEGSDSLPPPLASLSGWHVDNVNMGTAGAFVLLVGVLLSRQQGVEDGPLAVWPGAQFPHAPIIL